ncbi:hypothetical protein DL93DRAFT_2160859 [Clavulina sp. PMI_390]|nr:hypothetical protein DL93DRAFT_2160859 [Clavulina sp. PMI_390]
MEMSKRSRLIFFGLAFLALKFNWLLSAYAQQVIQDSDAGGPTFDSTWIIDDNGLNSGGIARRTDVNGGKATFKFTGNAIGMYGMTYTNGAKFTFTVDGTSTQDCTCWEENTSYYYFQVLVCYMSGLSEGSHSLVVTHDDEDGLWLDLDFLKIYSSTVTSTTHTTSSTPSSPRTTTSSTSTTTSTTTSTSIMTSTTILTTSNTTSTTSTGIPSTVDGSMSLASLFNMSSTSASSTSPTSLPSSHSSHTGAIAGGVVGGVVGLAIVIAALILLKRYLHRPQTDSALYGPAGALYTPSYEPTLGPSSDGTLSMYPLGGPASLQSSTTPLYSGGYSGHSEPHSATPEMSQITSPYGNSRDVGQAAAFPVYSTVDRRDYPAEL